MKELNVVLTELGISKVRLAKYLGVSRQMLYNYLAIDDLNNWPKEKAAKLLSLLNIECIKDLTNLKIGHIIFIVIYMLPSLFNLVIYFILTLFSISYSISLFKILFLKKNYNLSNITKKYIKILGVSLLFNLLSSIIDVFILPKILIFLI